MIIESFVTCLCVNVITAYVMCDTASVHLTATRNKQVLVSSEYEDLEKESAKCTWLITGNVTDIIEFRLVHWFAPESSDCSNDYLVTSDGAGRWSRPIRIYCKNSDHNEDIVRTRSYSLTASLVSAINWDDRIVFMLEYWTSPRDTEIIDPVVFGPANYVLIVLSSGLGTCLLVGCFILIYMEFHRTRKTKVMHFKNQLNKRRQGISGATISRGKSVDSIASEATTYIQLSETPTSVNSSSIWTPSPVTRISVSDTPTSGNYSM